jgi:hypothetical protein
LEVVGKGLAAVDAYMHHKRVACALAIQVLVNIYGINFKYSNTSISSQPLLSHQRAGHLASNSITNTGN